MDFRDAEVGSAGLEAWRKTKEEIDECTETGHEVRMRTELADWLWGPLWRAAQSGGKCWGVTNFHSSQVTSDLASPRHASKHTKTLVGLWQKIISRLTELSVSFQGGESFLSVCNNVNVSRSIRLRSIRSINVCTLWFARQSAVLAVLWWKKPSVSDSTFSCHFFINHNKTQSTVSWTFASKVHLRFSLPCSFLAAVSGLAHI